MDNVPMEYGKQQAALSGWENTAILILLAKIKQILTLRYYLNQNLVYGSAINAYAILTK